ncbi:ABC transporter permease [Streptomyces sioyaensis]|uniref:ABC transporter permease n=1 Tax=Streptomyces sioyaensis TaxID=67364 RepID=UPI003D751984
MLRTALRNVLAHKARLMMTALAVLLGVAFVSGTLVFGDTTANAFRTASAASLKDVAVAVQAQMSEPEPLPAGGPAKGGEGRSTTVLDAALAQKIRALPGVTAVRPTVNGEAILADKDGRPVNADNPEKHLATNYQPGTAGKDSRFPLKEGRAPAAAGELALDAKTAEKAGYRIGDTVRFATDGPALAKKLVGIVTTDDPRVAAGSTLALFDTTTAQKLFLSPGRFHEIAVAARPGTDERALTARVQALLPADGATATSGPDLAAQQSAQITADTQFLTKTLLAFAGISLFVGVFIIANTFTMLVAQRSREIALMRAVGASRRQVVRSVLIEAALVGLGASAAGFALGLGIAAALRPLLNAGDAGLPAGPLVVSPQAVLSSLAVGVVVTVLAAWLPSRKAAKVAPVEVLSSAGVAPPARTLRVRNVLGALLTGLGILVMGYVTTLDTTDKSNLLIAMLGSVLTLNGVIVLAPLLSRPLITLAGKVTTRFFGVSGKLARENALRNPRRTAATASALMIGLTLITGLTVGGYSTQQAMDAEAAHGTTADFQISNSNHTGFVPTDAAKVAKVPGVATAAPLTFGNFRARGQYAGIAGTDPAAFAKVTDLTFREGSLAGIRAGTVAVSDEFAQKTGAGVGDTLDAATDPTEPGQHPTTKKLKIVAVYEANPAVTQALGTLHDVLPYNATHTLDSIMVKSEPGKAGSPEHDIREALGNSPLLKVQNTEQITKEARKNLTTALNMIYGLLGMAVVIAVLGVINTLALSVIERTREIGMLRAIGLDRAGIKQMVRLESVVISLFGALLGIGTGTFLAWAGGHLMTRSVATYETVLPWAELGLFLALALLIGVLAAIWPARTAARLNMLQSIQAH